MSGFELAMLCALIAAAITFIRLCIEIARMRDRILKLEEFKSKLRLQVRKDGLLLMDIHADALPAYVRAFRGDA